MKRKELDAMHLEDIINEAYEEDEDANEVTLPMVVAENILHLIQSQEVKDPLIDVVFYAGELDRNTVCYHALINQEDFKAMRINPAIGIMRIKDFDGVFDKVFEDPVKPVWKDEHHAYCGECGKRLRMKYKPSFCSKCGKRIDYAK